ncbi:hypothetical protein J4E93_001669 [Alternaria ventricosa]|uniref:uncharacterized protein n=1 Tax=Alternaria ventricosa TaxID=1187951 RepID=UPI0020C52788|nr:uncharacterized protein J4E93_001669 [Alternaria ventricosa]KAI4653901.1 hypothetical protein J4E93_001669 [Alternaria ventricosa]
MPALLGGVAMASFAALSMPAFAILYGLVFGQYTSYGEGSIGSSQLMSNMARLCIILTALATLNWIANSFCHLFFLMFGELQARSARNRIFDALIKKDMAWFDTREDGIAAFLPTVQMHIRDLQLAVSSPFGEAVQSLVQGVASLGVAFYYSWNLTLVVLCTIPVLYLVQSSVAKRLSLRAHEHAENLKSALKYITTAVTSIETVKCFNGERYELHVFTSIVTIAASLYRSVANFRSMQIGIMQFFTISVFVQGFWYGSHLVETGESDPEQVLKTFWAALMAMSGMTQIMPQLIVLQQGKMAGARLSVLMKQISTSDQQLESQGKLRPERCTGQLEFRKVTFSYPSRADETAIRDASLLIRAGETTFVVGKSGSGKSTLGQLLVRFYRPCSGQIFLDGVPLEDLDVKWLRQNVTLVEQHSVLFNGTIRHNLALGQLGDTVDVKDIRNAVKFAMLEPVMESLLDGLDTELGMKGGSLSGGQRQRMALARARIRNSPVLILDESTSSLDYVTRAEMLDAIRSWRKGKTTIIITHDILQIEPNDFLYLLDNARVVQQGYRKELESQDGSFRSLLDTHTEADTDDEPDDHKDDFYWGAEAGDGNVLREESRTARIVSMTRPLSVAHFGQSVLATYPETTRASWGYSVPVDLGPDPRLSIHEQTADRGGQIELIKAYQASPDAEASRYLPAVPSAVKKTILSKDHGLRPTSRSNLHRRSLSFSEGTSSRSVPKLSTRPVSPIAPYSQSFVTNESVPVLSDALKKSSRNAKLLQRIKRFRRKNHNEETDSPAASLPMKEIFMSVWPAIGWVPRLFVLAASFSATIHAACTPVFAWVFAQLLTTFYVPGARKEMSQKYAVVILGIAALDGLSCYFMFFLSDTVAQAWTLSLKKEAMRRILMQSRDFFDKEENSVSRLAETLDHFAEEARNLPGRFACVFLTMNLMVCISIFWSMVIAWELALAALATGPVLLLITKCYNIISSRWERLENEAADKVGQVLHEAFVNIKTVRCLVLEDHFKARYTDATTEAVNVGIKRAIYCASIHGLSFTGVIFVTILLYWYGGYLMSRNEYTVDKVLECFLVLMLSVSQVSYMANYVTQINMARDAGSRLLRLARLPMDSHELTGEAQIQFAGDISLNKVTFSYPARPEIRVLQDVSFHIPQGSCTAIVGSSGAGKSTIASLLLKLYQTGNNPLSSSNPSSDMTVSNYDIQTLHTSILRSRMAIVPQTPVLFPGTIAENIAYGLSRSLPETSIKSIRAAATAAGIAEFIDSLPQGYNTLIGEGGTCLSGGQAQRVSIARALIRNPDVLILDEATSALDVASAQIIRETIFSLVHGIEDTGSTISSPISPWTRSGWFWDEIKGDWDYKVGYPLQQRMPVGSGSDKGNRPRQRMTVIIITHAREMMAIAEHIVVLDQGKVVEQGSFNELKRRRQSAFGRLLRGVRE